MPRSIEMPAGPRSLWAAAGEEGEEGERGKGGGRGGRLSGSRFIATKDFSTAVKFRNC